MKTAASTPTAVVITKPRNALILHTERAWGRVSGGPVLPVTRAFTNNQAERDLRPTKTQMKISGTFRSEASAKAWACIRGYLSTARKNGITAFDAIQRAITGNPFQETQPCS
jgi:transposase